MTDKETDRVLSNHVATLLEHFDSVRIFVTKVSTDEDGITSSDTANYGGGNFYATLGSVQEWLVCQEERARLSVRKRDADADSAS